MPKYELKSPAGNHYHITDGSERIRLLARGYVDVAAEPKPRKAPAKVEEPAPESKPANTAGDAKPATK